MPTKPMLAPSKALTPYDQLPFSMFASPKLDGIRCQFSGGVAYSRSLKPIRNPHVQTLALKLYRDGIDNLDGELMAGNGRGVPFYQTDSEIMSFDGSGDFTYHVFDVIAHGTADERIQKYASIVARAANPNLIAVQQELVTTTEQFRAAALRYLDEGYEGAMLKRPTAYYKHGRSTLKESVLLKVKPYVDAEAVIIGYEPLYINTNAPVTNALGLTERGSAAVGRVPTDMLGALVCRTPEDVVFNVGSGFTDSERKRLWQTRSDLTGKTVRFKYFLYGTKDRPRSPIFLSFVEQE